MSEQSQTAPGDARRKDVLTVVLLLLLVGTFGGAYYLLGERNKTIHDMNEENVAFEAENIGLKSQVSQLQETVKKMETAGTAGAAAAPASRRGKPLEYAYVEGSITKAWQAFVAARGRFEQPAWTSEQVEEHIKTDDLNSARGPELAEIACFEKLIGPEGSPYLRAIFESNAEEAKFSKDVGMAGTFVPGIETLLAYYVTVGEPASIAFLEGLLTGQIAAIAQTKFNGNYFTFATAPVVKALDECVGATAAAAPTETPTTDSAPAAETPPTP